MMRKALSALVLALLSFGVNAEVWQARYGVAETFDFKLYNADGTLDVDEADGGTEVSIACNEGAETTATNDFVDEGTFYSITFTAAELQCERISVVVAATTTEVFFIQTSANASAMTPTYEVNVATIAANAITATAINADAITAAKIANDAIGATEVADGAIDAATLATDTITAAKIATDSIGAAEMADNTIDAGAIAADAIGASEIATDAIGATEIAADAIAASEIATDAIGAAEIATDAIASAELAATAVNEAADQVWEEILSGHSATSGSAAEALAAAGGGGATDQELGIMRQGTAVSASATTLVMDSGATFADDAAIGMTVVACGSTQGYCQSRGVSDSVLSTDTLTVPTWTVTPSGTITFYLFGTAPASASSGGATAVEIADEVQTRTIAAVTTVNGLAANVITATSIASDAITSAKVAADAIGASEIATDAIGATEIAADAIGASEIAANALTTAEIATGAISSDEVADGAIDAGAFASDAITAAKLASDVATELQSGLATASSLSTLAAAVAVIDGIVDQLLIGVNVSKINNATITGDGSGTPFDVP